MKKLTGILGIAIMAMAMFFSASGLNNSNEDINLSNLFAINDANAEVVCSVKNIWGNVVMSCSTAPTNCSASKAGYTLTCSNAKLD